MSITVEEMNLISIYHDAGQQRVRLQMSASISATWSCLWWTAPPERWRL